MPWQLLHQRTVLIRADRKKSSCKHRVQEQVETRRKHQQCWSDCKGSKLLPRTRIGWISQPARQLQSCQHNRPKLNRYCSIFLWWRLVFRSWRCWRRQRHNWSQYSWLRRRDILGYSERLLQRWFPFNNTKQYRWLQKRRLGWLSWWNPWVVWRC